MEKWIAETSICGKSQSEERCGDDEKKTECARSTVMLDGEISKSVDNLQTVIYVVM